MDFRNEIEAIVYKSLPDDSFFIVEIIITGTNNKKILILVDGDQGLDIDTCTSISRKIGNEMEEMNLFEESYVLEVSSPGVDHPLTMKRQYIKNIGRKLRVTLTSEKIKEGELIQVKDEGIVIKEALKTKSKIVKTEESDIFFLDIKKSNVLVSFN